MTEHCGNLGLVIVAWTAIGALVAIVALRRLG